VASQDNGVWGAAIQVPGLAAMNTGVEVGSEASYFPTVSCAPAGTCTAGGAYTDHDRREQGFVVTQTR
jgi:hypothetical protein